jgi:hypothetical protein
MNTLTLRSPTDMLAAVPYLLGFHPTDSVVLLGQRDTQVSFQVRCDTPKTSDAAPMAAYLATVAARQLPTAVIIIGYGPEGPLVTTLEAVGRAVEAAGVPVLEVLRVHDGRYWSLTCADPQCCAPGGAPFDASASAVAAAATYQGMVALPDRSALGEVLAPLPGPGIEPELLAARERLAEVVAGGARRRRVAARAAVREALDRYGAGGRLDDDEVAWLAVLLGDVRARDDAWRRMLGVEPCAAHE